MLRRRDLVLQGRGAGPGGRTASEQQRGLRQNAGARGAGRTASGGSSVQLAAPGSKASADRPSAALSPPATTMVLQSVAQMAAPALAIGTGGTVKLLRRIFITPCERAVENSCV